MNKSNCIKCALINIDEQIKLYSRSVKKYFKGNYSEEWKVINKKILVSNFDKKLKWLNSLIKSKENLIKTLHQIFGKNIFNPKTQF